MRKTSQKQETGKDPTDSSGSVDRSLPTGTVTFLFTDIVGSTPLWERHPGLMAEALKIHNTLLREAIETHGGVVFKTVGDAFQAAFSTAPQALKATITGQHALRTAPWNELGELKVRMGLHTGEAELDPGGDEYAVSHTKNRVARIMSAAHGRQVLLSAETKELVDHHLTGGLTLKDLGKHRLKGMEFLEHLFQVCAPGLETDFPPLATESKPKHNLPLQLTSFIGREKEIEEVCNLLSANRLVTLTGVGGTGKTRLSLQAAEAVLDVFPDGVWFAELAGLADSDLVPRTVFAALGLQESASQSPLEQLKTFLHDRSLLIVLDNCEHVIADCARVSQALLQACPNLKILTSSREALGVPGEVAYPVPSLTVPDPDMLPSLDQLLKYHAFKLFVDRAQLVNPNFKITEETALAVIQVCYRLDGIPLAIELAAAKVSVLSVQQIVQRLDNRFRLLTGGPRTALPRQQTLQASIDWSYSLLPETERLLLMRLSVFRGGWTLKLAEEVCAFDGLDEFDVLDGLASLVSKSLIITVSVINGENRYWRLETIGQYAREKLLDSGRSEAVLNRHLDAFLHLAEEAEPYLRAQGMVEWLDRLELELDNLRAALAWAFEGDIIKGLRLVTALYWFWGGRAYRVEGEAWLRRMNNRAKETIDMVEPTLLAEALAQWANLLCAIGKEGPQVTQLTEEASRLAEGADEFGMRIQVNSLLASAKYMFLLNQPASAHKYNLQALEKAEDLGDLFLIAEAARFIGQAETDPRKSKMYLDRSQSIYQEFGDLHGLTFTKMGIGNYHYLLGELFQAQKDFEESIHLAKLVKNRSLLLYGMSFLGRVISESGESDLGIDYFLQALEVARDLGEVNWIIWNYNGLGWVFGLQKNWHKSEDYFLRAEDISETHQLIYWKVYTSINLAEVAHSLGKVHISARYYQRAAKIGQENSSHSLTGLCAIADGKASLLIGDLASAESFFQTSLKDFFEKGNIHSLGPCLEAMAICATQAGQFEKAVRLFGVSTSRRWQRDPSGMPWYIPAAVDELLAPAREALGDEQYARLFEDGKAMTLGEAVVYALETINE